MAASLTACALARRPSAGTPPRTGEPPPRRESLADYVARVRARAIMSGVQRSSANLQRAEAADPVLRAALAELAKGRTADRHNAVAAAYIRLGIRDLAFDHLTAATAIAPLDGAAYDGLARLWRDWGFPALGLADAHRAVYYLPRSAAARHTLGTVFQALGFYAEARGAYEAALTLDPRAPWTLNNLCTLDLAVGRPADAARACRRALELDPTLLAARRNLVLAEAAGASAPAPELAGHKRPE
jgi:tetratricopeptide (TPR) repeat protein